MNIIAAIRMFINSKADKPLDITLDEMQKVVNRKPRYKISEILGIPYNTTHNVQVLSEADDPIFSVEGSGRILQIIPATSYSGADKYGTVLLHVDGDIVINNRVTYATGASNYPGVFIVDNFLESGNQTIYTDMLTSGGLLYLSRSRSCRTNVDTYSDKVNGIFNPTGIPFNDGFELRMTQAMTNSTSYKTGVIVVYELYE